MHTGVVERLAPSLLFRSAVVNNPRDLDEMMQILPIAAAAAHAEAPTRLKISCRWAELARASQHISTSTAYKSAFSLLQDSLALAPTLDIQHFCLVKMRDDVDIIDKLPLDYASYQVHMGQLTRAVETLERGRCLIWSEMRDLRACIDEIDVGRQRNSQLSMRTSRH